MTLKWMMMMVDTRLGCREPGSWEKDESVDEMKDDWIA